MKGGDDPKATRVKAGEDPKATRVKAGEDAAATVSLLCGRTWNSIFPDVCHFNDSRSECTVMMTTKKMAREIMTTS